MQNSILGFKGEFEFLSNFVPCTVILDGKNYPSVEHAYQAAKSFQDKDREMIRLAKTPGQSKKLGKLVKIRDDWELVKEDIMLDLLIQKFSQPYFSELLLGTEDKYLEETNWWNDKYWGVCNGKGLNRLGHLLMLVRSFLNELK